jgi:hypothetical protein
MCGGCPRLLVGGNARKSGAGVRCLHYDSLVNPGTGTWCSYSAATIKLNPVDARTHSRCMAPAWMALACCHTHLVCAAPAIEAVRVDLNPLIDSAARSPEQFAVNIPRAVSSSAQGSWSQQGSLSTWVYSARIATAISMSFHASHVLLPPSAVLTVSTARTTVKYVARDVSRNGLWGVAFCAEFPN